MNKEEIIEELNHHGYKCYDNKDKSDIFYIKIKRINTLNYNSQTTLTCQTNNQCKHINVICGNEIIHDEWYDLWRKELDEYQNELNEEIKLKAGIWFEE